MRTREGRAFRSPARILVAEDDADMRALVAEALRKDGYGVETVSDGGRLLVRMASESASPDDQVDLIVSDVRMPVCNGLRFVELVRKAKRDVPVILMTAFGDETTRRDARALGALLFDKPFEIDDLRAAVASVLRAK